MAFEVFDYSRASRRTIRKELASRRKIKHRSLIADFAPKITQNYGFLDNIDGFYVKKR